MASRAILSNFFEKRWTQNHPQHLSGLSRALFPTTFLEIAVYWAAVWQNSTITSCRVRQVPTKEKEFAYITGFSSNVYKTISAAEPRISTKSTPRSYISAMLLALKSLLFFCLDVFEP